MNYPAISQAIQAEIKKLAAQQQHLEKLLKDLSGGDNVNNAGPAPTRRKRSPIAKVNLPAVLSIIKDAKKINAVSLGHQLRKQGLSKVPTAQLVEAGVKVAGTKGGTTYSYAG